MRRRTRRLPPRAAIQAMQTRRLQAALSAGTGAHASVQVSPSSAAKASSTVSKVGNRDATPATVSN